MVGSKLLGNLGSFGTSKGGGLGGFGKDGGPPTDRSNYQTKESGLTSSYADRSFIS